MRNVSMQLKKVYSNMYTRHLKAGSNLYCGVWLGHTIPGEEAIKDNDAAMQEDNEGIARNAGREGGLM